MGSAALAAGSFFPLDEELELLPGSLTPGLEEMLVRLGSWMPFAQAQGLLVDWMKLNSLSEASVKPQCGGIPKRRGRPTCCFGSSSRGD